MTARIAAAAQAWLHDEIQALDDADLIDVLHQQETDRRRADPENMLTLVELSGQGQQRTLAQKRADALHGYCTYTIDVQVLIPADMLMAVGTRGANLNGSPAPTPRTPPAPRTFGISYTTRPPDQYRRD